MPSRILESRPLVVAVQSGLQTAFEALGATSERSQQLVLLTFTHLEAAPDPATATTQIKVACSAELTAAKLRSALDARAVLVARQVEPHILGSDVLDVGCGDGMVALSLHRGNRKLHLLDVVRKLDPRVALPFDLIPDHGRAMLPQNADVALLLTVLHHADNPGELIESVARASPARIVVIESVLDLPHPNTPLETAVSGLSERDRFQFCAFFDWFFNRALTDNRYVPYNFAFVRDWHALFAAAGYSLVESTHLGIDQVLVPEIHELMVFDRKR